MTAPLCLLLALLAISWSAILIRLCEAPALVGAAFVVMGDWGAGAGLLGNLLAVLGVRSPCRFTFSSGARSGTESR